MRRSSYLKAFDKYKEKLEAIDIHTERDSKIKKKKGSDAIKKRRRKKDNRDPMNLSRNEIEALRTLKKKIQEGELVVSQTDKSSRFAVLTRAQYLESGQVHTAREREIGSKDV